MPSSRLLSPARPACKAGFGSPRPVRSPMRFRPKKERGRKRTCPRAERGRIAAVNAEAAQEEQSVLRTSLSRTQTLLIEACPLGGPISGVTGWTMMRVNAVPGYAALQLGLGLLLALMAGMAGWLTW